MITTADGEVKNLTPISEHIRTLNNGGVNADATEALAEVIKRVRETGKGGAVTITLKVAMMNERDENAVTILASVASKMPAFRPVAAILYSTADGDLIKDDPRQRKLPLQDVSAQPRGPAIEVPSKVGFVPSVASDPRTQS